MCQWMRLSSSCAIACAEGIQAGFMRRAQLFLRKSQTKHFLGLPGCLALPHSLSCKFVPPRRGLAADHRLCVQEARSSCRDVCHSLRCRTHRSIKCQMAKAGSQLRGKHELIHPAGRHEINHPIKRGRILTRMLDAATDSSLTVLPGRRGDAIMGRTSPTHLGTASISVERVAHFASLEADCYLRARKCAGAAAQRRYGRTAGLMHGMRVSRSTMMTTCM